MEFDFQRASLMKRVPAWMFDMILLMTLAAGLIAALAALLNIDTDINNLETIVAEYEQEYGIELTTEDEEELKLLNDALNEDQEAVKALEMVVSKIMIIVSLGILGAFLLLEFLVPILLKNGQTLGKKIFGVALMREDGVKVTTFMMFTRTVLGKYTVETMLPLLFLMVFMSSGGIIVFLAMLLVELLIPVLSKNKACIHDRMACTVAVDLSSQMIFNSAEEMEAYHESIRVNKASDGE